MDDMKYECPLGGDTSNDCDGCAYSGDYHFDVKTGECIEREVIRLQIIKPTVVKKIAKEAGFRTSKGYTDALNRHVEGMIRSACSRCTRKTLMVEDVYESAQ
jgi:hypothetical protein